MFIFSDSYINTSKVEAYGKDVTVIESRAFGANGAIAFFWQTPVQFRLDRCRALRSPAEHAGPGEAGVRSDPVGLVVGPPLPSLPIVVLFLSGALSSESPSV